MSYNILFDTGFWYAFFDKNDNYHKEANKIYDKIQNWKFYIPHPVLYETLNSKFTKNNISIAGISALINDLAKTELIPDDNYKEKALQDVLQGHPRKFSLVDTVIRKILQDTGNKIDYFVTFNAKDFYDVCFGRKIILIDNANAVF